MTTAVVPRRTAGASLVLWLLACSPRASEMTRAPSLELEQTRSSSVPADFPLVGLAASTSGTVIAWSANGGRLLLLGTSAFGSIESDLMTRPIAAAFTSGDSVGDGKNRTPSFHMTSGSDGVGVILTSLYPPLCQRTNDGSTLGRKTRHVSGHAVVSPNDPRRCPRCRRVFVVEMEGLRVRRYLTRDPNKPAQSRLSCIATLCGACMWVTSPR